MKITEIEITKSLTQGAQSFVEQPVLNETQLVLTRALALLGPNGENWLSGTGALGENCMCTFYALSRIINGRSTYYPNEDHPAVVILNKAARQMGYSRNEFPDARMYNPAVIMNEVAKDFSVIRSAYERAITLAATP